MPTCLLIRHGRTTANAGGILAGWTPGVGLDEVGRSQALTVGAALRGVRPALVVSSPLQRCLETAEIIRGEAWPELEAVIDERVAECRYGAWTGRSLKELGGEPMWRTVQHQPSAARFPDGDHFPGESVAAMSARLLDAVRDHDARVEAEHGAHAVWVLVSHGDPIKAVLADAGGAHLDAFQRYIVSPASVSAVMYTPERPFVLASNASGNGIADLLAGLATKGHGAAADDEVAAPGDAVIGGGR